MTVRELSEYLSRHGSAYDDFEIVLDTHDGQGLYSVGRVYDDIVEGFVVLDIKPIREI